MSHSESDVPFENDLPVDALRKLELVLELAENERALDTPTDTPTKKAWSAKCLFCRDTIPGRTPFFQHMFVAHGFNPGLPDNLVYFQDLIATLRGKLDE